VACQEQSVEVFLDTAAEHQFTLTLTTRDSGTRWKAHFGCWNRARAVPRWELFCAVRLAIGRVPRMRSNNESQTHHGTGCDGGASKNGVSMWPQQSRTSFNYCWHFFELARVVCLSTTSCGLLLTRSAVCRRVYWQSRA